MGLFLDFKLYSIDLYICPNVSDILSWLVKVFVSLKLGNVSWIWLFFFKIDFHVNFRISLPTSAKYAHWDFDRDYFESVDQFGAIAIFLTDWFFYHYKISLFISSNSFCLKIYFVYYKFGHSNSLMVGVYMVYFFLSNSLYLWS